MTTNQEMLFLRESQDQSINRDKKVGANLEFISLRMGEVLGSESVGGNAGYDKINGKVLNCAGVNFYYDKGVIQEMGNVQDLSPAVRRFNEGTFKVGFSINKDKDGKLVGMSTFIVEVYMRGKDDLDFAESKAVLEQTKLQYNIDRAQSVEDLFAGLDLHNGIMYDSKKREIKVDDYLKLIIIKVVQGEMDPRFVTSNYGLRKKVIELRNNFINNK